MRIQAVRAERVTKRFDATMVLRGVDLEIVPGRLTLLEGANGSGKSTLLGVLAGTVRPDGGTVSSPPAEGIEARARVGLVSHETLAYGELTGRANVELAASFHGLDPAVAWEQVRERFELGSFAERKVRTNSRGQKQRVALARALVHAPDIVLLDEPTTGLDPVGVERLLKVLEEEVAAQRIVLVVSHEPQVFQRLAPRRIALEKGKIVEVSRSVAADARG